jgi:hypothetical protein
LCQLEIFELIALNPESIRVHRKSDVREDVHQWWECCDKTRFTHVDIANAEAGDVLMGGGFTGRGSTRRCRQRALRKLPKAYGQWMTAGGMYYE